MDAAAQPAAAPQEDFSADFDKEQFRQMLAVKALRVPTRECHRYMKALTPWVPPAACPPPPCLAAMH
jgi:hypothetical protein